MTPEELVELPDTIKVCNFWVKRHVKGLRYHYLGRDWQDLISDVNLGVWLAARSYNVERGTKWSTWLIRNIAQVVFENNKKAKRWAKSLTVRPYQSMMLSNEEECQVTIYDKSVSPIDVAEDREFAERLIIILPDRLQHIVRHRFLLDKTLLEVSQDMRISRERVRQLEKKALQMLRDAGEKHLAARFFNRPVRAIDVR